MTVRVHARSGRERIRPTAPDALEVWTTAPPLAGRANEAVIRLVAEWAGVPRSTVSIVAGEHGRTKILQLPAPASGAGYAQ